MSTTPKPTRRQMAKGLGALAVLVAGLIGIPAVLAVTVGWPLPRRVPTGAQIGHALRTSIPDSFWPHLFATLGWLAWAYFLVSVVINLVAQLQGRRRHRRPRRGIQGAVAALVTAVFILSQLRIAPTPRPIASVPTVSLTLDAAPATAPSLTSAAVPVIHTVVEGDTLWGIAATYYCDGERWHAIYQANAGVPQPGGGALSDPHWIYPGWRLAIPVEPTPTPATSPPLPPAAVIGASPPVARPTPVPATKASTSPGSSSRPSPTTPRAKERPPNPGDGAASHPRAAHDAPVRLPSGSVVAGSFAAAVLSALALGRLRRRHAYRYQSPRPGRGGPPEALGPALRRLSEAGADARQETSNSEPFPVLPFDDPARRQHPGRIDIGIRSGEPVTVELADMSRMAVIGSAQTDIVRAMMAALLVRAGPGAAEVVLTAELAERLLPGLDSDGAVRRVESADHAARIVEAEVMARTRRLDAVDAPDAAGYRAAVPEDPLSLVLVVLADPPEESWGRWSALLVIASRLDVVVLFLGDTPAATSRLVTDANRVVADATPLSNDEHLAGVELFGLRAEEAAEMLGAVAAAYREGASDADDASDALTDTVANLGQRPQEAQAPARARPPADAELGLKRFAVGAVGERPIVVQVLGPCRISVHGEEVKTGLRSRAKMLLVWYLLRPEGATSDGAVDALWPDTPPERVQRQFWYALGDLRARLRGPEEETLEVLTKAGEQYQPTAGEIACDLWEFQHALTEAANASNENDAREALKRAVFTYRGDLLEGSDYSWVETVRHDLHRRALDAHLRLAEHEENAGHSEAAVEVVEQAINLDRYAEEPYRRLMALYATRDRPDAVTATWRLLLQRLGDLNLDVEAATVRLYRSLTETDAYAGPPAGGFLNERRWIYRSVSGQPQVPAQPGPVERASSFDSTNCYEKPKNVQQDGPNAS